MERARFDTQHVGTTGILTPRGPISSLAQQGEPPRWDELSQALAAGEVCNVIIDFAAAPYFGAAMLDGLRQLSRQVGDAGGRMALCNVSDLEYAVLRAAHFDSRWPIYGSRDEALSRFSGA
jgi:anti-anti-sigma regulatory factor